MINGKKFYGNMKEVTEKNNGEIIQKKKKSTFQVNCNMKQSITWKLQIDTSKNQTIKMSLRFEKY